MAVTYYEVFPKRPTSRPHARIISDTTAITGTSSGSEKPLMLLGSAQGGKPDTVYEVTNMIQAREIFRGGELVDAMELAWNPSSASFQAGKILAMRVDGATPATITKDGLTLTSKLYGVEANEIQVSLTKDYKGARRFTVSKGSETTTYDNIGEIFTVTAEDQETAKIAILGTAGEATKLTITLGEAQPLEFTLGKNGIADTYTLVNTLNSIDGIRATIAYGGDKNVSTALLDPITEKAIGEGVTVTSVYGDLENQLSYNNLIEVVSVNHGKSLADFAVADLSEVTPVNYGIPLKDFAVTNLAGAQDGVIPTSWAKQIAKFANEGGYYMVPLTPERAIHAEARAFVTERNNEGEPMRAIVGGAYDETPAESMARARALKSDRVSVVGFSAKRTMDDGRQLQLPAYMMSAQVAGFASGLPVGESVTFKHFVINELSSLYDGNIHDTLNNNGVIMANFVRNRNDSHFRIEEDITTYMDRDNFIKNSNANGEAHDFLVSELRVNLEENFIGRRQGNTMPNLIKSHVVSFLEQKKRDSEIQDFDTESVQVIINGSTVNISAIIYPIASLRKIEMTVVYRNQTLEA